MLEEPVEFFPVGSAGVTTPFLTDQPLILTSGLLVAASDNPASIIGFAKCPNSNDVLPPMVEDPTNNSTNTQYCPVSEAYPGITYRIANTTQTSGAVPVIGSLHALHIASGVCTLDSADAIGGPNKIATVIAVDTDVFTTPSSTTTVYYSWVTLLPAACTLP
jgi:hypothetical protein